VLCPCPPRVTRIAVACVFVGLTLVCLEGCVDHGQDLNNNTNNNADNNGNNGVVLPATASIGAAGGAVGVGQAQLTIPAGALTTDTQVSIAEVAGDDKTIGSAYELSPDGLALATAATLSVGYDATQLPSGYQAGEVAIVCLTEHYEAPAGLDAVAPLLAAIPYHAPTTIDAANTIATGQLDHFSTYAARPIRTWPLGGPTTLMGLGQSGVSAPNLSLTFDVAAPDSGINTSDGQGTATVGCDTVKGEITMLVETNGTNAGDLYAHGLLAKLFRVEPSASGAQSGQIRGIGSIADLGGAWSGNCVYGEVRFRLMDLGTRQHMNADQVPVMMGEQGYEWQVMPPAYNINNPHNPPWNGVPVSVVGTAQSGRYYALVVDLLALAGGNFGGLDPNLAATPSHQVWWQDEFYISYLDVETP